ncbi:MAG TPA: hypothetical protein DEQ17_00425, partial [Prevotella sp.]|nr:hypothetical protein [Prevotella sp.]
MTSPLYIICTIAAQVIAISFSKILKRLDNAWFFFDTLGLASFTITGIQKTLECGYPFWVAIIMGCMTGCAGGLIRDVLLNKTPVLLCKEIYAMASIIGGLLYWFLNDLNVNVAITGVATFLLIVAIRILAVKYHISLPVLKEDE